LYQRNRYQKDALEFYEADLDWFALSFVLGAMHFWAIVVLTKIINLIGDKKDTNDLEAAVVCFYILTFARIV